MATVIGISGPSGSGKSLLAQRIHDRLAPCCVIQQDWFFVDPDRCPLDANFCDLQYLHVDEFVYAVQALCSARSVEVPAIDFRSFRRIGTRLMQPEEHVLVEGMTIYRIPEVRALCDYRFYLAPPFAEIEVRKRDRDAVERNKSLNIIDAQLRWMRAEYSNDLKTMKEIAVILEETNVGRLVEAVVEYVKRPQEDAL